MKKRLSQVEFDSQKEIFATTYATFDIIRQWCRSEKGYDGSKAIDLYLFYCKQSAIQETKTTLSNNGFAAKGLGWTKNTVSKYRGILTKIGVIQRIKKRDDKGQIVGNYVKVQYIAKVNGNSSGREGGVDREPGQSGPNTVGSKVLNTDGSKDKNIYEQNQTKLVEKFTEFREVYPRKKGKAKSKEYRKKLVKNNDPDDIISGARKYALEMRGKDKQYIKRPQGWLNEKRWIDYLEQEEDDLDTFQKICYPNNRFSLNIKGAEEYKKEYGEDKFKELKKQYDAILFAEVHQPNEK